MAIDVRTDIEIDVPLDEVATYTADPSNAPEWYTKIKSVEWETEPKTVVGARIAFVAHFLGKRLAYTYEIMEYTPGVQMLMSTAEGPFPMETTYAWSATPTGTHMTLRNAGAPSGFSVLARPFMAAAIRRANRKDLALLKRILESD